MKKLLSFLAALLLLGTMTVDMKAATIYVEDDGNSFINLWWWKVVNGTETALAENAGYEWPGPNLKEKGTKVTGSNGKTYYTFVIDDSTTHIILTHNQGDKKEITGLTTSDFDNVFTVSGGKTSTTVVSVTGGGGGGDDDDNYTAYSFYLKFPHPADFDCGNSAHNKADWYIHNEPLDADGKYTYSGLRLSSNGFNFMLKKGSSEIKFVTYSGDDPYQITLGEPLSLSQSGTRDYYAISDFDSTKSYDFAVDYKNKTFVITEHSDTPVEKTYTVKYNNGMTAWAAVWAYAVDDSDNAIEASKQLTDVTGDIYTYSFTTTATPSKVYFSDSEITDTASLTGYDFENNKTYGEAAVSGDTYTVYYNNSETKWTNVYGFWKYGSNDGNKWPGEKLTANSEGKYVFTFTTEKTPTTVIFNNGSTGAGNQTENFKFENGKTYGEKEAVDYSGYLGSLYPEADSWTVQTSTAAGNVITWTNVKIGNQRFNMYVADKDGKNRRNYTVSTTSTQGTIEMNKPTYAGNIGSGDGVNMVIKDATADQTFDMTLDLDSKMLTVVPHGVELTTVYFIRPAEWGENYTPYIQMFNNATNVSSGAAGTIAMSSDVPAKLNTLVDLADGEKLYSYTCDASPYTALLFSKKAGEETPLPQTRNLVIVNNGIYRMTNVMLPSMQYFPEAEHDKDKVQVYSTTDNVTKYISLYLSFANPPQETATESDENEFFAYNKCEIGNPQNQRIGVNVYIGGKEDSSDPNKYRVTGWQGTTWMYEREIAGKKFFRVDFPEYLIEEGKKVDKIEFYKCDYSKYNDNEKQVDASTSEEMMSQAGKSFWYEDVELTNGRVFYRPPMADKPVHVSTLFTPLNLWLVAKDPENGTPGSGYIKYTDNQGTEHTYYAGAADNKDRVRLMPSENANGKITYNLHNVDRGSTFNLAAQFRDGDGNYVYYAYTGNTNEFTLVPNNDYTLVTSEQKTDMANITPSHYIIDPEGYQALTMCDITVRWADQVIFVSPVRTTAGFSYESLPELEGDNDPASSHRRINAIADNGAPAYVYVSHNKNFGTDAEHYKATNTSIIVRPEFQDYIKGRNKGATVGKLTAVEDENSLTADDQRLSKVAISAHTAGIYSLYVAQTKTLDEFHTTSIRIPVRVSPTLQSIGLLLNENYGIFEQDGILKCTPNYNHEVVETTAGGNTIKWDKNRVKLVASQAEAGDDLEIWFADASAPTTNQADAKYVIRREASAIEPEDELNTDPAALGYTKYDINHTLKLVGDDGKGKDQDISFIVKQSGITGAPQTVKITPSDTNLPTAVDEIEAAAAEAVYYNLNGIRVDAENLQPGIYVVVKGTEVSKVLVR